ncbi:hypothetical protein COU54_01790 [Candidatus Pacearchaeota archaeon CG10_big_fil_rev_8_21_14_0_10_31_24]|nr:MAG: hypothetical protein COU54_01790 [Candidatus Pacearchaeota archaeon CG10_big_fil_rev_8_21_14_0_10_31_24]
MKRKIIKQANQAYTITLPINWIRENNLSQNSELDITQNGKSLIVNTDEKHFGGSAKIDISNLPSSTGAIYIRIAALYAKGVDEITITSNKDRTKEIIEIVSSLLGLALVSQDKDKNYIIKDVSGTNYHNLDEIFKRTFQILLSFYESAIEDIFGASSEKLEDLKARDIEVNKFCLYLQRTINKNSYSGEINGRIVFTYSFELEKIGDEISKLWKTNIESKTKKPEKLKEIAEITKKLLEYSFDLYHQNTYNSKLVDEIFKLKFKLRDLAQKLFKTNKESLNFSRHLIKIAEDSTDLIHLTLMRNISL